MTRKSGFTLVELLVVIVIISILLAFLLPAVTSALCNAKAGTAASLVRQIEVAAEQYEKEQNVYPAGDGSGSSDAYSVLTEPGPRGLPYIQKRGGDTYFINPIDTVEELKFRNNAIVPPPSDAKNTNRIDIWCSNCDQLAGDQAGDDAINNY